MAMTIKMTHERLPFMATLQEPLVKHRSRVIIKPHILYLAVCAGQCGHSLQQFVFSLYPLPRNVVTQTIRSSKRAGQLTRLQRGALFITTTLNASSPETTDQTRKNSIVE